MQENNGSQEISLSHCFLVEIGSLAPRSLIASRNFGFRLSRKTDGAAWPLLLGARWTGVLRGQSHTLDFLSPLLVAAPFWAYWRLPWLRDLAHCCLLVPLTGSFSPSSDQWPASALCCLSHTCEDPGRNELEHDAMRASLQTSEALRRTNGVPSWKWSSWLLRLRFSIGLISQDSTLPWPWHLRTVGTARLPTSSPLGNLLLCLLPCFYSFVKWAFSHHLNRKRRSYITYPAMHRTCIQSEASLKIVHNFQNL